jgi:molybdate transport system substrate-binding protein
MDAPKLKLVSSMATRELLAELAGCSARELSQPIDASAAGGVDVMKRVQAGEAMDLVVLASNVIDRLIAEGHLLAYSRADLVKSGVAIAVPKGAPHPDISTEAAVKQAVRSARAPGYSTGPSGTYLEKLFDRWGILGELKSRLVTAPPGVPVASLVAAGQCDLGFQQLSEMVNVPGIDVIGPLPPSIQLNTVFSAGISAHSQRAAAARRVLEYFASPATADVKRRHHLQPA